MFVCVFVCGISWVRKHRRMKAFVEGVIVPLKKAGREGGLSDVRSESWRMFVDMVHRLAFEFAPLIMPACTLNPHR